MALNYDDLIDPRLRSLAAREILDEHEAWRWLMGSGSYFSTAFEASPLMLWLASQFGDRGSYSATQRDEQGLGMAVHVNYYRWRGTEYVYRVMVESFKP